MPTIELSTDIDAPIERVFDLVRSIDAHVASASRTDETAIAGRTSGLIGLGETVTWQARHFGILQTLSVEITAFERPYHLEDTMVRGAFKSMRHNHRFVETKTGTLMTDDFEYRAPLGPVGWVFEQLFLTHYLRRFLIERNRVLKATAESEDWQRYLCVDG